MSSSRLFQIVLSWDWQDSTSVRPQSTHAACPGQAEAQKMCDDYSDQASLVPGFPSIAGSTRRATARPVRGSPRGSRMRWKQIGPLGSQVHLPGSLESRGLQAETKAVPRVACIGVSVPLDLDCNGTLAAAGASRRVMERNEPLRISTYDKMTDLKEGNVGCAPKMAAAVFVLRAIA